MKCEDEELGLVIDRKSADEWLTTLIKELRRNQKDKVDLMMNLYPPAIDKSSAENNHPYFYSVIETNELNLHSPVKALMNAILHDPGKLFLLTPSISLLRVSIPSISRNFIKYKT